MDGQPRFDHDAGAARSGAEPPPLAVVGRRVSTCEVQIGPSRAAAGPSTAVQAPATGGLNKAASARRPVPWQLTAIRTTLRLLPAPLRERWAVKLFLTNRDHGEPQREKEWRGRGTQTLVAGLAAVRFGPTDRPAALLLHGWEGRGLQLSAWIDPLLAAGYQVIALDGPGHGRNRPQVSAIPFFAMAVQRALAEEPIELIVAHSMGAVASIVAGLREGYTGDLLCLGGPPHPIRVTQRARAMLGLPESGMERFLAVLEKRFAGVAIDRIVDLEEHLHDWQGHIHGVLAASDDDIPPAESQAIIEAAGGDVVILEGPGHRSIMWDDAAVAAGMAILTR